MITGCIIILVETSQRLILSVRFIEAEKKFFIGSLNFNNMMKRSPPKP